MYLNRRSSIHINTCKLNFDYMLKRQSTTSIETINILSIVGITSSSVEEWQCYHPHPLTQTVTQTTDRNKTSAQSIWPGLLIPYEWLKMMWIKFEVSVEFLFLLCSKGIRKQRHKWVINPGEFVQLHSGKPLP